MPNQAKKVNSTQTCTEKSTKNKKKKKNSSSQRSRKECNSGSDNNEGIRKKSKSRQLNRERSSTLSDSAAASSQEDASTTSCRVSSSSDRCTSSSSGENLVVSYQSDLDCTRRNNESSTSLTTDSINESLRWDNAELDNPDDEHDRLHVYKINRRKRYIAVSQRNNDEHHVL